ncbi:NYN domain-containing protein [Nesterenkonia flava]|uniref:NYN domain-containing protein n=1 Tax=Nesterenkonia flava TaxID=469799 RepID=A0ABU1FWQ7_9MICC|nr:NYN domain-containing protein [Nesterenkonia flava]MDR5713119.1 NYN domain-containing protein [Nesterenkonia flava]
MADRVVLFVDYQNVYMRARDAFAERWADYTVGQIDPVKLGEHLVKASPYERELTGVRIYRGQPDSSKDPKGYGAARRQRAAWEKDDRVTVLARPLRYPFGWPESREIGQKPEEKGVDVALAIDFAAMAVRKQFDVGILFSADTDLKPALEFVSAEDVPARAEVAAWAPEQGPKRRLRIDRNIFCHWLGYKTFHAVSDPVNYTS